MIFKNKVPFFNKVEIETSLMRDMIQRTTVTYDKTKVFVRPSCNFFIDNNFVHQNDLDDRFRMKGFATPSSLMMIDGKPKSRKTTFAYMMAAAHLSPSQVYENIVCTNDPNNWVMIFDTEQSPPEFLGKIENLKKWAQDDQLDRLHAHNLALYGHNPEMKIQAINYYVKELDESYRRNGHIKKEDQIGLIIIDHIGDLVNNENNKEEVKDLLGWMSELANSTGATILAIIHQNKKDDHATGMLGYDSAKKVSSYIKTFKKDIGQDDDDSVDELNPTEVSFKDNRFGANPFRRFIFNYDEYDFPIVLNHKEINYNFMGK